MLSTLQSLFESLQSSYLVQQLAPLLVLFAVPAFALFARTHWHALSALTHMLLDGLGISFLWNWGGGSAESAATAERHGSKKKSAVRTRKEQIQMNGSAIYSDMEEEDNSDLYYPGLVNVSGTYCFLNSVLQAMSSLAYLQPHIDAIHTRAVELDVPTPVIDALQDTLRTLNTPRSSRSSFRPIPMINALSQPEPGKRSKLFASREHQDAQELFQLLSECLKAESLAVAREGLRDHGLGAFARARVPEGAEVGAGVFDGLTANRRSCVECGYTEAVMHFTFDNWTLSLPRTSAVCALQDCLADYIRLELLTDCICRKCSMLATLERLHLEADRLKEAVAGDVEASQSKKKRAREARKLEAKVKAAIDEGRIEEDIRGVKMEKVFSKVSTKQAMIARPPKVLVLHLNRSVHYGGYAGAGRNSCRVMFPEILDLTPYTTSGQLSTSPSVPISAPPPLIPRSTTPTQSLYATPHVLYRLSAVVCHYGMHSFGHYVCFRRKPRTTGSGAGPCVPTAPKMACPYGCECAECAAYGHVRDGRAPAPGRGWLRTSDDAVEECGLERVLGEGAGAFLLFYERVAQPRPSVYPTRSPRSSEDTVRPAGAEEEAWRGAASGSRLEVSESGGGSGSGMGSFLAEGDAELAVVRPRVVRRTAAGGRSRSASTVPRERAAGEAGSPLPEGVSQDDTPSEVSSSVSLPEHPVLNGHTVPPPGPTASDLSESFVEIHGPSSIATSISASDSISGASEASEDDAPVSNASSFSKQSSLSRSSQTQSQSQSRSPSQSQPQRELTQKPATAATSNTAPSTLSRTPSPLPSAKAAQSRIQAPQPVHAAARMPSNIVPDRAALGLRA